MAHLRLSLINGRQGRLRDATHHAIDAWEARQSDVDLLDMIAKRLFSVGETGTGRERGQLRRGPDLREPGDPRRARQADVRRGALPKQALPLRQRARELGMDTGPMHYLMGLSLHIRAISRAREREFEDALAAEPDFAHAAWSLAKLRKWTGANNHVERLRADVARVGEEQAESALFHYALFKELDDLGRTRSLADARNRDAPAPRDDAPRQRRDAGPVRLPRYAGREHVDLRSAGRRPDAGLHRRHAAFGQTLLERILGAHSQVAAAGELHEFT